MKRTIIVAIVGLFPGLAFPVSPLRLECASQESVPGRALVCEYAMLGRQNERLADLHEGIVRLGREGRVVAKRWLAARDACADVECLDRFFETGIREAQLALVDVESRQPARILASARGVPLRIVEKVTTPVATPPAAPSLQETAPRQAAGFGANAALILLAAVVLYGIVARRLAA